MATRFYFGSVDGTNAVSPAFDPLWEQTGQATRRKLYRKTALTTVEALTDKTVTVPITTTQDICNVQFISDPLPAQRLTGAVYACLRGLESATTANAFFCVSVRYVSNDGGTVRSAPLFFQGGSEYTASATTKVMGDGITAQALPAFTLQQGDRLCIEIGTNVTAPTAATTCTQRFGTNGGSDFALTAGLTTDLNPWIEFSQNFWSTDSNNYQFVKVGDGMSASERIR